MGTTTGYKWINNGIDTLYFPKVQALEYIKTHTGWKLGKSKGFGSSNTKGFVTITNGISEKMIHKSKLNEFLRINPGWYRGRSRKSRNSNSRVKKDTKLYNDGNKTFQVPLSEIESFKLNHPECVPGRPEKFRKSVAKGRSNLGEEARLNYAKALKRRIIINPGINSSKAELKIVNYLRNYFNVIPQYFIEGYYHPYDMLVELPTCKLLIEYDGTFYHSDRFIGYNPKRDVLRKIVAKSNGFKFLVIKESEFKVEGLKLVKRLIAKYYPEFINMHLSHEGTNNS